jgi:hypothetical protein
VRSAARWIVLVVVALVLWAAMVFGIARSIRGRDRAAPATRPTET